MKEHANHNELARLTIKKLANESTSAELERLAELLDLDPSNQKYFDEQSQLWEMTKKAQGITDQEVESEWNRLDQAISQSSKPVFPLFKIAASFAILLLGSYLVYQFVFNSREVNLKAESVVSQKMTDGSNITLHAHAELSYPKEFSKHSREVHLNGEAFFEIAKDPQRPFIIHTSQTDIRVIGTTFNVKAEQMRQITEVVVVSGEVEVSNNHKKLALFPGEKAIVNGKTGKVFKIQNDDPNFQSWRTRQFEFYEMPLDKVAQLLGDAYGQTIKIKNGKIGACPVTVSFNNQPLASILKVLASTLDLSIQQTEEEIIIDGEGCE